MRRDPETPVHLGRDHIEADGAIVRPHDFYYLMVNKPRGIVTTAVDEKGRQTVYSLLDSGLPWVAPVGRLDMASEGLLLLTNDSEWAARISDPHSHLDKIYHVQIDTIADETLINQLGRGVRSDGELLRAKRVRVLRTGERNSWLEIILDEGRNRHIRRMLEQLGIGVLRLVRVAIGPLALGQLGKGKYRDLAASEKLALDQAMRIAGDRRNADEH
jgi:23S rRNA pseudouridine2605 synthase